MKQLQLTFTKNPNLICDTVTKDVVERPNQTEIDRAWADRYIPEMSLIVGPRLLVPAPIELDRTEATDLIVLTARNVRIACRVRRPNKTYLDLYGYQFTIRSHRVSGAKTELAKLLEGFGDWMFYGFAASEIVADGFARWFIIDLEAWRSHMVCRDKRILSGVQENYDGETSFNWYDLRSFPPAPPILVASSETVEVK